MKKTEITADIKLPPGFVVHVNGVPFEVVKARLRAKRENVKLASVEIYEAI